MALLEEVWLCWRRCGFAGGGMTLRVGFEVLEGAHHFYLTLSASYLWLNM